MQTFTCKQRGMTLISLMIGLVISMLAILGSLSLYKTLISVATDSKLDAQHDGQLAAAMLTVQMEIQNAGYGIDEAGTEHVIETEATVGGAVERDLRWRFLDDTTYVCRRLVDASEVDLDSGLTYRVLKLMTATDCDAAGALTTKTWDPDNVTVLGRWPLVDGQGLTTYIATHSALFEFEITSTTCSPYGATLRGNHLQVSLSAPSSAEINGVATLANTYEYCLPNTYPAI